MMPTELDSSDSPSDDQTPELENVESQAEAGVSPPASGTPWWKTLYNHNPFYVISTVLMLTSVRAAYGEMAIGSIDCWVVMAVLASYTWLLAVIGVCIIRFGKVWEDARSILLLLLLLFLGISVSMDDLFVKLKTSQEGALLAGAGFLFAVLTTEAVLWLTQIRLRVLYRVPYDLFLLLFFVTPWWMSPEFHPRSVPQTEWLLLGFSIVVAGIILALLPAVWAGPKYVRHNGTPWRWPLFPWSIFGMLIVAAMIRSYALCLTFGPSGPIWLYTGSGSRTIVFSTIWGTWFLVPILAAVLLLWFEGSLRVRRASLAGWALWLAPILWVLSLPYDQSEVFQEFWQRTTLTVGSPIWLTTCLLIAFYGWAMYRKVNGANVGLVIATYLLACVEPRATSIPSLIPVVAWPLVLLGVAAVWQGIQKQSAMMQSVGCGILIFSVAVGLTRYDYAWLAQVVPPLLVWLVALVLGVVHRDDVGCFWRAIGGLGTVGLAAAIVHGQHVPIQIEEYRFAILIGLAVLAVALALSLKNYSYLLAFGGVGFVLLYGFLLAGFRQASAQFGAMALLTFGWSLGLLLIGLMISAHKAGWLQRRATHRQWNF